MILLLLSLVAAHPHGHAPKPLPHPHSVLCMSSHTLGWDEIISLTRQRNASQCWEHA